MKLLSYSIVDYRYYLLLYGAVDNANMHPSDKKIDTQVTIRPVGFLF